MATLKLDTVENAMFSQDDQGRIYRRTAMVYGASTLGSGSPATVCFEATRIAGMPQYADPFPTDSIAKVVRVEAMGIVESADAVRVLITYSTPSSKAQIGIGGGSFLVEDDVTLAVDETQVVPGKAGRYEPIILRQPLVAGAANTNTNTNTTYQATVQFHRPIRTLSMSGLVTDAAAVNAVRAAIGRVNDKPWLGLDAGYWLLSGAQTRTTDLGLSYAVTAQVVTRVSEDWSHIVIGKNQATNQFFKVSLADASTLSGQPYKFGIQYPGGNDGKGILRLGPYETVNLATLFGLS